MAVKLELNISNQAIYLFMAVCIVLVLFVGVNAYTSVPSPGHGANEIKVTWEGNEKTLQEYIDSLTLECITGRLRDNLAEVIYDSTEGETYDFDYVFIPSRTKSGGDWYPILTCNLENGWRLTGCSASTSANPADNDESMRDENACVGDQSGDNYVHARCCRIVAG